MATTNYFSNFSHDAKSDVLAASVYQDGDKFDHLGRNVSAQQRRQNLVPWVLVDHQRVPVEDPPEVKRASANARLADAHSTRPRLLVD